MDEDAGQLGLGAAGPPAAADDAGPSERGAGAGPPVAAPSRRQFCGVCGAAWQDGWSRCGECTPQTSEPGAPAGHAAGSAATDDAERRRLISAIVLYFALLAVSLAGFIAAFAGASELSIDFGASAGMSAIIAVWCAIAARRELPLLFRPAPAKWLVTAVGAAFLTFALAYVVIEGLIQGMGLERIDFITPYLSGGYGLGTIILMSCVQPAIFEELAFRGIVFSALRPTLSTAEAVFVSAGMFMILHLAPGAFPHTFAMGVIAGFLRARTDSLLPGVLMHFVHNLLCVVTEYPSSG